jgi:hypothetical protein
MSTLQLHGVICGTLRKLSNQLRTGACTDAVRGASACTQALLDSV